MKATHKQVDAMMAKVKDPNLTKRIFDIMKDGRWRTASEIGNIVTYSKRTVSARINDIKQKLGYKVDGQWGVETVNGIRINKYYFYRLPLKNGKPIPCPPKEVQGLKCWACRNDDGYRVIYAGSDEPTKYNGVWLHHPASEKVHAERQFKPLFPPSIKPGKRKRVIIPMAKIVKGD